MTKYLKSLKRELAQYWRYAVTVKDTDGNMWVLRLSNWSKLEALALYKEGDKPLNLEQYLCDKKTHQEILKRIPEAPSRFWTDSLEDYEEGQTPTTLDKKTVESISIGLHYGTSRIKVK